MDCASFAFFWSRCLFFCPSLWPRTVEPSFKPQKTWLNTGSKVRAHPLTTDWTVKTWAERIRSWRRESVKRKMRRRKRSGEAKAFGQSQNRPLPLSPSLPPFVFTPTFLLLRLSTLTTRALDVPSYILLSLALLLSNMTFLTLHASILLPPHPDVHGGVKWRGRSVNHTLFRRFSTVGLYNVCNMVWRIHGNVQKSPGKRLLYSRKHHRCWTITFDQ